MKTSRHDVIHDIDIMTFQTQIYYKIIQLVVLVFLELTKTYKPPAVKIGVENLSFREQRQLSPLFVPRGTRPNALLINLIQLLVTTESYH